MPHTPEFKVEIITSEFYDNRWNCVVGHTFYGNTEEEILSLIEAHKKTDSFFKASFEGEFKWEGGTIKLKNEESGLIKLE